MIDKDTIAGLISGINGADGLRPAAIGSILTAMDLEPDELQAVFDKAVNIWEKASHRRKARALNQAFMRSLASALEITNFAAFSTGLYDGIEQGFELSMGLTYGDTKDQWEYDIGTHIGACLAVRGSAA